MSDSVILVTGATGASGGHVARELLAHQRKVRALVHREDERSASLGRLGAEIVCGDLLSLGDIRAATRGISAAYFVFPLLPTIVCASAVIAQACKENGVALIANMSQLPARPEAESAASLNHWLSEQVLNWSGVPIAHIRATFFMEWLLWITPIIQKDKIIFPWNAKSRYTPVATEDLGRFIATILESPAHHAGKTYTPVGPELISYGDLSPILGTIVGRSLSYQQFDAESFANLLGLGHHTYFVNHCRSVAKDLERGVFEVRNTEIQDVTGTAPMTVENFVTKHLASFAD